VLIEIGSHIERGQDLGGGKLPERDGFDDPFAGQQDFRVLHACQLQSARQIDGPARRSEQGWRGGNGDLHRLRIFLLVLDLGGFFSRRCAFRSWLPESQGHCRQDSQNGKIDEMPECHGSLAVTSCLAETNVVHHEV
jgi:hypothetical protein